MVRSATRYMNLSRMMNARWMITSSAILTVLLLIGCDSKPDAGAAARVAASPSVGVLTLHPHSIPLTVELPGRVVASQEAEVRPQVSGILERRWFEEGSQVRAGEELYQIDAKPYQAAYDTAAAALLKARAAVPSAQAKADRNKDLLRQNAISQQEFESAVAALAEAKADVAAAQAAVETARINLQYTHIRAPISGRIDRSALTPGALVTAGQATALTTIHRLDPVNVDLTQSSARWLDLRQAISAGRIRASNEGVKVELELENGMRYPLVGQLAFAESSVTASTGTYTMRAQFPNPERLLLPGMYVRALVEEGTARDAFLIPQRAVSRNPQGNPTAWFVKHGKAEQRILSATRAIGNDWLIEAGVADGDQVIVEGSQLIRDGQAVVASEAVLDKPHPEAQTPKRQASSKALSQSSGPPTLDRPEVGKTPTGQTALHEANGT